MTWRPTRTDARSYLFLDESGQPGAGSPNDKLGQYLGLAGCAIHHDAYVGQVIPEIRALKARHFPEHSPEAVVLHRADVLRRRGPFSALRDPTRAAAFDAHLLRLYEELPYILIGVVIDKDAHGRFARRFHNDAYHWGLALMLERYCGLLKVEGRTGLVVCESRGAQLDRLLQRAYERIYERGTTHHRHPGSFFQQSLSSKSIRFRNKRPPVAGLELADGIVKVAKTVILTDEGQIDPMEGAFAVAAERAVSSRWNRRRWTRKVRGDGKVFFTMPEGK